MKTKIIIENIDSPNINGRIYTMDTVKKIVEDCKDKIIYGGLDMTFDSFNLSEATHEVTNIRIENNSLVADIKILKYNDLLLFGDFGLSGFGCIDENGVVYDYELRSINFVKDTICQANTN